MLLISNINEMKEYRNDLPFIEENARTTEIGRIAGNAEIEQTRRKRIKLQIIFTKIIQSL